MLGLQVGMVSARSPLDLLSWGASLEETQIALAGACMADRLYNQNPVVFPLAESNEQHYLCLGYRYDGGIVDKVIFVLADDALVQIEARGNAVTAFVPLRSPIKRFSEYLVFDGGERYASVPDDAVWFMSHAARHSSLYVWSNPFLAAGKAAPLYAESVRIPAAMTLGASLAQLLPALRQACPLLQVVRDGTQRAAGQSAASVQCLGYEFAGFPRMFEVSFGRGGLERIKVAIGQGEVSRLTTALLQEYGEPTARDDRYLLFPRGGVVLDLLGRELLWRDRIQGTSLLRGDLPPD